MQTITITLIRHASTKAIEQDLYCGLADIEITKKGVQAITELMDKGMYPLGENTLFFTTGLKRTVQTLQLIYGEVCYTPLPWLNEQDLGKLDMRSLKEIEKIDRYRKWLMDKTGEIRCPGGESYNEFKFRIKLAFYKMLEQAKKEGKNALLITHASVIAVVMSSIFYDGKKTFKDWQPAPGFGYTVYYNNGFTGYENIALSL
ncbi:MAG: histidine phosphatase family protein [Defluviitaleaceae bacterium]|nr:histidine phosphatase family protein [Defluviitaleaceae bacterium]